MYHYWQWHHICALQTSHLQAWPSCGEKWLCKAFVRTFKPSRIPLVATQETSNAESPTIEIKPLSAAKSQKFSWNVARIVAFCMQGFLLNRWVATAIWRCAAGATAGSRILWQSVQRQLEWRRCCCEGVHYRCHRVKSLYFCGRPWQCQSSSIKQHTWIRQWIRTSAKDASFGHSVACGSPSASRMLVQTQSAASDAIGKEYSRSANKLAYLCGI